MIGLLMSNWKLVGAGIGLALVLGYIGLLKFDIRSLEDDVGDLENQVKSLELDVEREKGNVRACQARIEETNNRITDLKEDADSRDALIDMLADNIDLFKEASESRIELIENSIVGESCEDALEFLRKGVN